MKIKKTFKILIVILSILTVFSVMTAVGLSVQKEKNQETIDNLKATVSRLEEDLTTIAQHKEQADLNRFKDTVFKVKYPNFNSISRIVYKKCKEYGFNPYTIMALIQVESNFNPYAISTRGAYGLMQIRYSIWKDTFNIDIRKIFNKEYNIDLGLRILKHYYKKTSGNLIATLQHYNGNIEDTTSSFNNRVANSRYLAREDHEKILSQNKEESL